MSPFLKRSILFSPIGIGSIEVPNRFVRSATHEYMAEDNGATTGRQAALYRMLAEGEVGLIITGHAYVNPAGKASPRQTGVDKDAFIPGLYRLTKAVHEFPTRIFLQLSHAGRQTKEKICGCVPVSPSAVPDPTFKITPREMTAEEIQDLIQDFVHAGQRAKEAHFDGVQIHVAHGYLLSSFISPHTNRRTDRWGGSVEARARVVVEIVRGLKKTCGRKFPVIAKLNATDFLDGGLTLEESVRIAQILETAGVDGLEVSGGMSEAGKGSVWQGLRSKDEEGYFVDQAARIKTVVSVPVFGLGGFRTFAVMDRAVSTGRVDLVSLSRPLIRDPFLIKKFRSGGVSRSECISCNKCFNPRGITCGDLRVKARSGD